MNNSYQTIPFGIPNQLLMQSSLPHQYLQQINYSNPNINFPLWNPLNFQQIPINSFSQPPIYFNQLSNNQNFNPQTWEQFILVSNLLKNPIQNYVPSLPPQIINQNCSNYYIQDNQCPINPNIHNETKTQEKQIQLEQPVVEKDNNTIVNNSNTIKNEIKIKFQTINRENNDNEIAIEPQKVKYYRCTFKDCDKVFPKECNLKEHIRTHTGEKPYKCSFSGCEKSFSQHGNLKKHEKVHIGDKKYFCDYPGCGKKFSASYNLKIHYRCHTGERPYKCSFPNCQRSFFDKGNLKYHEKSMHLKESLEFPYSCEHMSCNAKFKTQKDKLEHHYKMEPDCLAEREELIKLIQRYKILIQHVIKENQIDKENNEVIKHLKDTYQEIQGKLINQEYFKYYLGENFDAECAHVDELKEEEQETEHGSNKAD